MSDIFKLIRANIERTRGSEESEPKENKPSKSNRLDLESFIIGEDEKKFHSSQQEKKKKSIDIDDFDLFDQEIGADFDSKDYLADIEQIDYIKLDKMPKDKQLRLLKKEYLVLLDRIKEVSSDYTKTDKSFKEQSVEYHNMKKTIGKLKEFVRVIGDVIPDGVELKIKLEAPNWSVDDIEDEMLSRLNFAINRAKNADVYLEQETADLNNQIQGLKNKLTKVENRNLELEQKVDDLTYQLENAVFPSEEDEEEYNDEEYIEEEYYDENDEEYVEEEEEYTDEYDEEPEQEYSIDDEDDDFDQRYKDEYGFEDDDEEEELPPPPPKKRPAPTNDDRRNQTKQNKPHNNNRSNENNNRNSSQENNPKPNRNEKPNPKQGQERTNQPKQDNRNNRPQNNDNRRNDNNNNKNNNKNNNRNDNNKNEERQNRNHDKQREQSNRPKNDNSNHNDKPQRHQNNKNENLRNNENSQDRNKRPSDNERPNRNRQNSEPKNEENRKPRPEKANRNNTPPVRKPPAKVEPIEDEITENVIELDDTYDPNQAIDVDPYLESLSEEAKYIIRIIGEVGVSRNAELKDVLTEREDAKPLFFSGTKFQKNNMNNAVNDLINAQILTNDQIKLGSRGGMFKIYQLDDLGKHLYFSLTNEIPVKSELARLVSQHKSAEHGFLIKDSADIFREMGYTVFTERKDLRHDLDGGKRKDFDIIIEKDGEKCFIEVERGTHNDEDFYKAMDKIRQVTEEFYFICPNEEVLFNKTKRQFFMWIQKHLGGMEHARGIKANFTTFGKLKEGKKPIWDDIEL